MMQIAVCASEVCFSPSRYTGKERDAESGNDYFGARYYSSSMGKVVVAGILDERRVVGTPSKLE